MIELVCRLSSRTLHEMIWPMPFILLKRGKFSRMANEAKSCRPSVNAPNTASVLAMSARSEEHTSELQSLMRISYAVFCLKKKKQDNTVQTRAKEKDKLTINIHKTTVSDMTPSTKHTT